MKVRTCVIFVCMTVVPGLALFSHQLPAGVRGTFRTHLWEPVEAWVASLTKSEPPKVASAGAVDGEPRPPTAPVSETPSDALPASIGDRPAATTTDVARPRSPFPPAGASPAALALESLGATALDCRPFDGLAGTHVASCRVAVDAAGQLHRVFQAAGGSPDAAYASLLETVRAWKERVAVSATMPRM